MDESEIELGEEYRDLTSGFVGKAIARHEFLHGCTRVTLQAMKDSDLKEYSFDAPGLEATKKKEKVTSRRTGGPGIEPTARPTGSR